MFSDFIDSFIESPELNDVFLRGLADLDSLSREDYYRFSNMNLKAFWFFSAGYFQFRTGTLDEGEFHEIRMVLRYLMSHPGWRDWWMRLGRESASPSVRDFIEKEFAEIDVA